MPIDKNKITIIDSNNVYFKYEGKEYCLNLKYVRAEIACSLSPIHTFEDRFNSIEGHSTKSIIVDKHPDDVTEDEMIDFIYANQHLWKEILP